MPSRAVKLLQVDMLSRTWHGLMGLRPKVRSALAASSMLLLASCVAPIKVRYLKPPAPPKTEANVVARQAGARVLRMGDRHAQDAAVLLLDAIRDFQRRIQQGDLSALEGYNYLVARLVERIDVLNAHHLPSTKLQSDDKPGYELTIRHLAGAPKGELVLRPVDGIEFYGKYAIEQATRDGIGAPLLMQSAKELDIKSELGDTKLTSRYRNATAVVRIRGQRAELDFMDPFAHEQIDFLGRRLPMAADFGVAACMAVSRDRVDELGMIRLINPSRFDSTARVTALQTYDPKKRPVLLVHGLLSTPATWLPLYLKLMDNPQIRRDYQFLTFSYPSGYPFAYSATLLRKELARMRRLHPNHKDLVIIGHSMGGLISRLMVTDAEQKIWKDYFGTGPQETRLSGKSRELLEDALIFNHQPGIAKAIFVATPHRGSSASNNWFGRAASRLVRLPETMTDLRNAAVNVMTYDEAALELQNIPNSIDTLSPDHRFMRSIADLPLAPHVSYHSLIGDRGRGDSPESSDGVVAYWSSHLEGAASEAVIPSGHSAHQHPEGIREIERILLDFSAQERRGR